jgi:hypothetical protein
MKRLMQQFIYFVTLNKNINGAILAQINNYQRKYGA